MKSKSMQWVKRAAIVTAATAGTLAVKAADGDMPAAVLTAQTSVTTAIGVVIGLAVTITVAFIGIRLLRKVR